MISPHQVNIEIPDLMTIIELLITHLAKHYIFYLYVESPKDIFTLQPAFVRDITAAQDKAAAQRSSK